MTCFGLASAMTCFSLASAVTCFSLASAVACFSSDTHIERVLRRGAKTNLQDKFS
jgi:hypothetical protein